MSALSAPLACWRKGMAVGALAMAVSATALAAGVTHPPLPACIGMLGLGLAAESLHYPDPPRAAR